MNLRDFTSVDNVLSKKSKLVKYYSKEAFNIIATLIRIVDLPEDIEESDIQALLFIDNSMVQFRAGSEVYYDKYSTLPPLNSYYNPTKRLVTNPYNKSLGGSKEFTEGVDCVTIKCDTTYLGYADLISWYANFMADCDISINRLIKNSRYNTAFLASNSNLKKGIENYIKAMEENGDTQVIEDKALFELIKTKDFNTKDIAVNAQSILAMKQYCKAQFYLALGVPANYDMKPEYKSKDELSFDIYSIAPKVDNVIENLNKGFEKGNEMFGTKTRAVLGSSLVDVKEDLEREQAIEDAEIEDIESKAEETEEPVEEVTEETKDETEVTEDTKESEEVTEENTETTEEDSEVDEDEDSKTNN